MSTSPPAATFDSLALAAVVYELRAALPARVGRATQTAPAEITLPLRAGAARGVTLSCDARWARAHLTARVPSGEVVTPFLRLLRARFDDARLVDVRQPPFERVLVLEIEAMDGRYALVAELMGKHANVLLTAGGEILGAMKVVGPERSRRPVVPGWRYAPPPPDARPTPAAVDAQTLGDAVRGTADPLWRRLLSVVSGIGPLAAYELTIRAGGDPEATAAAVDDDVFTAMAAACHEVAAAVSAGSFDPRALMDGSATVGFAPWPLRCWPADRQRAATMSGAIEAAFARRADHAALEDDRRALLQRVDAVAARKRRALTETREAMREAEDAARWRRYGELLFTYATFVPVGAATYETVDYDGQGIVIPMDPRATAVANAQAYFRRYAKAQAIARSLPARVAQLEADVAFLAATHLHGELATSAEDLTGLRDELDEAGYGAPRRAERRPMSRGRRPAPALRAHEIDGFAVIVGRTNRDNDHVTFKVAAPDDLWLHARGIPGAHVVIRGAGRTPAPAVVEAAAAVAAYYSAARDATRVAVDVTERRHVWKPKGAAPGAVLYRNERTEFARPRLPEATPAPR